LLFVVSLLPVVVGMSGYLYATCGLVLNMRFIYWSTQLLRKNDSKIALTTFRFSIIYLLLLFIALLVDHYV